MKLTNKELLQLFCIVIIEFILEILAFIIVPIAVAFTKKADEHLPRWAKWFEDAHDYYEGKIAALNGDIYWRTKHYPEPKNRTYLARVHWLLRNRIGYFSSKYLGAKVADINPNSVVTIGNPKVTGNQGVISDFCKVTCTLKNGKTRWGYYKTIRWCKWFYIRIYIGWKLMDIASADLSQYKGKENLKAVWAFNPFKRVRT